MKNYSTNLHSLLGLILFLANAPGGWAISNQTGAEPKTVLIQHAHELGKDPLSLYKYRNFNKILAARHFKQIVLKELDTFQESLRRRLNHDSKEIWSQLFKELLVNLQTIDSNVSNELKLMYVKIELNKSWALFPPVDARLVNQLNELEEQIQLVRCKLLELPEHQTEPGREGAASSPLKKIEAVNKIINFPLWQVLLLNKIASDQAYIKDHPLMVKITEIFAKVLLQELQDRINLNSH